MNKYGYDKHSSSWSSDARCQASMMFAAGIMFSMAYATYEKEGVIKTPSLQLAHKALNGAHLSFGSGDLPASYVPQTPLGRKLFSLRSKAIAKGMPLLSAEEIANEVEIRRGGVKA